MTINKIRNVYFITLGTIFLSLIVTFIVNYFSSNPGRHLKNINITESEMQQNMLLDNKINFITYDVLIVFSKILTILIVGLAVFFLQELLVRIFNHFVDENFSISFKTKIFIPAILTIFLFASMFAIQYAKLDNYSKLVEDTLVFSINGCDVSNNFTNDDDCGEDYNETLGLYLGGKKGKKITIDDVYYKNCFEHKTIICNAKLFASSTESHIKICFVFENDKKIKYAYRLSSY